MAADGELICSIRVGKREDAAIGAYSMDNQGIRPDQHFVKLFSEVCGTDTVSMLGPQFPETEIYWNSRFIDFAIRTTCHRVGFGIDGSAWHYPASITIEQFEDHLLRQNSLILDRCKVFRWTERQIWKDEETVRERPMIFLASDLGLMGFSDFLPREFRSIIEFQKHQMEAVKVPECQPPEGLLIAILAHAADTGQTIVNIADATRLGGWTLVGAHTTHFDKQPTDRFRMFRRQEKQGIRRTGSVL